MNGESFRYKAHRQNMFVTLLHNLLLEYAKEAQADFIVSGDLHLLGLVKFEKIRILSPADYLKECEVR